MEIGTHVRSHLYAHQGPGKVVKFNELFGEGYAEVLFKDGSIVIIKAEDLIPEDDLISRLQDKQIDLPAAFLTRNLLLRLEANISEKPIVTSANYKITPLPHQLLAVNFVMNRFQPRTLIADEVGLGKTIEAILVYEEYKLRGIAKKVLIVVPSGLVLQWHEELAKKFNEKFVIYSKEYIRTLKQSYGEETNVWKQHDKIIVSIDSIKPLKIDTGLDRQEQSRREWHNQHIFEDITTAGFDLVIIDEAHKLSKYGDGHESARFKLGEKLSQSVPMLLLLTATPHQGNEHLFLNLLRLIDPVIFTSTNSLTPALVREVAVRHQKRAVVDFAGKRIFKHRITSLIEIHRDAAEHQEEIELYDFVTEYTSNYYNYARRTNNQILMFLVILYQRIVASSSFALLDAMQRRKAVLDGQISDFENDISEAMEENEFELEEVLGVPVFKKRQQIELEKTFVAACIERAEKLTAAFKESKFRKLIEVIDEIREREQQPDLKFVIFTEFRATQDAIIKFLKKFGFRCSYIHGALSREEKAEQIEVFRGPNQILVSTDAGGEGINLQFCYCMINFDLPWNPSRLEQRIGRIDRIGQAHDVLIFNFHLTDTIEDRVRRILESKLEKIKKQFGEDKYADVLNLIQEEFSFDQIYLDAVHLKEVENKQLDEVADKIFRRAKEILEKDDLLLPFSQFNQDARELINPELNDIIKFLVIHYCAGKLIPVNWYKEEPDFCYFNNPFPSGVNEPPTYRNVTFSQQSSTKKEKVELVNLGHPLIRNIREEQEKDTNQGTVSVLKIRINKFQGISGFWFVLHLSIKNYLDRSRTAIVNVFMEDAEFFNRRISHYLDENIIEESKIVQNFQKEMDLKVMYQAALKHAEEKANEIFTATKLTWVNEINAYESKFNDYFRFKQNALAKIPIENIRQSRLNALAKDREEQNRKFQLQRNIVPNLELHQLAFVEFE